MDAREWTVLGVALGYLLASLVVGWRAGARTSSTATGFVAGDRALGTLVLYFITGATIFSAFAFLGAPGWAWSRGGAAYLFLAYGTLGFLPFYWIGPRAARLGRAFGVVTQAELVATRFQRPSIALVMALVSLLAFVPYLALQIQGAGIVLETLSGGELPRAAGGALVYGVVLLYVWRSGVLGVGWTNTLQGVLMMVLAWVLGLYLPRALHGGLGPMFEKLAARGDFELAVPGTLPDGTPWTRLQYSSRVLVLAAGFSFWPHLFMKAFTARSDATLRRTVVLYPTFQLFLLPILLIGFAAVGFEPAPPGADSVLPHVLMHMDLPALVIGVFCAGALAASMSSGDAILHSTASILVRDGWRVGLGRDLTPEAERSLVRLLLLPVAVAAYVVATVFPDRLVGLLVYAYGPVGQLAPPVLATLYWRRATGSGVLAGLLGGSGVTVALALRGGLPLHEGAIGLGVNVALLVGVSLLTRVRDPRRSAHYLAVASGREGAGPPAGE